MDSGSFSLKRCVGIIFFALLPIFDFAQTTVNAYAKVTSVTNFSVLALSNVNVSNHTFTVGGSVIVMQMQDNVIGTNTTNASTFGDLSTIANAGRFEIRTISAVTPTSGAPTSVTLSSALSNTYNTGSNSSVQMISFRDLGANYTTTANISGLTWDGNVGGVVAFYVTNTLTLNHQIIADGLGFTGGAVSNNAAGDLTCVNTSYTSTLTTLGRKGSGIYLPTVSSFTIGRGKLINGGGGGSENNAGGGGGGNYTAGGDGGLGYPCTTANSGRGIGGISLSAYISSSRVFMGGGGGGGQANNGVATPGGNGGGIILVKANTIATSTTCASGAYFSANGVNASNSGNDGAGGGGAGGSVVIQATNFAANATCSLTVRANGGNGGTVGSSAGHGGGGGGGQGAVIYSSTQPTANVSTQTTNGTAGGDTNTGTVNAGNGGGTSGSGIIASSSGPLPIELIEFTAVRNYDRVLTRWSTASEKNNAQFVVERSEDGVSYAYVTSLKGAGNSSSLKQYSAYDYRPLEGMTYYRLKQIDVDGSYKYSPVVSIDPDNRLDMKVIPNPIQEGAKLQFSLSKISDLPVEIELSTLSGEIIYKGPVKAATSSKNIYTVDELSTTAGVYFLKVVSGSSTKISKVLVQ